MIDYQLWAQQVISIHESQYFITSKIFFFGDGKNGIRFKEEASFVGLT